ncbi:MAG: hypothetical protein HYT93_02400 [Parcubacteria group bacterium]|nr:hypothetical protein [Parcubacteria group bacterium]
MSISKHFFVAFTVLFTALSLFLPHFTEAALPFGGQITKIKQCVPGLLLSISPPRGGEFMYIPGSSFSYAYGPPRRIGQWLLGMAGPKTPCFVPCKTGLCIAGFGNLIIFHGSSM